MKVVHKVSYCDHCEREIVMCGLCGMNTCSGGYGEVDGKDCPECINAYKLDNEEMRR